MMSFRVIWLYEGPHTKKDSSVSTQYIIYFKVWYVLQIHFTHKLSRRWEPKLKILASQSINRTLAWSIIKGWSTNLTLTNVVPWPQHWKGRTETTNEMTRSSPPEHSAIWREKIALRQPSLKRCKQSCLPVCLCKSGYDSLEIHGTQKF